MPSVFAYVDYRQYLADLFVALKQADPTVSYRAFARMAGSTSPNFLQLIRDRKLNIQSKGLRALARSLHLSRAEQAYLATVVAFDHAKTHSEKDRLFHRILGARQQGTTRQLDKKQYEYFSHWYIPVVRELVTSRGYTGDPGWIASQIVPAVSVAKVRKAIELLHSLGLIRRDEPGGHWKLTDRVVSTPSEVLSLAVTNYHHDVIALGGEAIERFGAAKRDIRAVTLGLSKDAYPEVKKRMEAFWRELLAYAATQESVDEVYQVNMQLFPLTRAKRMKRR